MYKVIIQEETTKNPLQLIGYEAGVCWGAKDLSPAANIERAKSCIDAGHGRTMEFPQIYITLDGYSARVIRELYTHIGGGPTRLQASTRYIKYGNFDFIVPPSIEKDVLAKGKYFDTMKVISDCYADLEDIGIPKEDIANILPLGMTSKIVLRTNLRNYLDMAQQRKCSRAYWEFRDIIKNIDKKLSEYSEEWKWIIENHSKCKCDILGYCPEANSCGKYPNK